VRGFSVDERTELFPNGWILHSNFQFVFGKPAGNGGTWKMKNPARIRAGFFGYATAESL
jgi:hypothetical protein